MEKSIKLSRLGLAFTEKELTFGLNVGATAEANPQAVDFYKRAYVTQSNIDLFNNVPNNKGSKRIPLLTTGNVLKAWACTFTSSDVSLSAKEVAVDKCAVMVDICISDVEDSFLVDRMTAGANNDVNPEAFLQYVWNEIGLQAGADIERLRWNGDKASGNPFLALTNGYIKIIKTAGSGAYGIKQLAGSIDNTNVIAELYKVIARVPKVFRQPSERNNLNIFVSSDVALAFQVATANSTAMGAYVTNTGDLFIGRYKLIETCELPDKTIIASPKQDLVFTYDLVNDEKNFVTIDRRNVAADEVVRFRVNTYFGFDIHTGSNIVFYGNVAADGVI